MLLLGFLLLERDLGSSICAKPMRPVQGYLGVGEEVLPTPPVRRVLLENS